MLRPADHRQDSGAIRSAEKDLQLVARVRRRDLKAFEALYWSYQPRLSRFLINVVRRQYLVEEVLDDTMMVVWNRPESFHGRSKLSTWLFAIAYRKALKALHRDERMVAQDDVEVAGDGPLPDHGIGAEKLHDALIAAIAKLSPDHRAVIDLTYFHEMGYREIAEVMGCPVDTVKTRMFYARRHLKRELAGEFSDWI